MKRLLVALALGTALAGRADARGPATFRPELYFAGRTHAEGAFVDGQGRPQSRFSGQTRGRREADGSTTFDQVVSFDDGTSRAWTWRIVPLDAHRILAIATDVIGVAQGEIDGRVLRLAYSVRTDPANPLLDVDFEQTMELQPEGRTVTNHSLIRKFGILVREARESFVRSDRERGTR